MRVSTVLRGNARRLSLIAAAAVLTLGLAACSSDDEEAAGTPFTQALNKDYADLAGQASSLAGEKADESFWDSLNPFSSGDSPGEQLSKAFNNKAQSAAGGTEPEAEAPIGPVQATARARLMRALAAGKDQFPEQAARAQADYDCWVLYGTVPAAAASSQACKTALDGSLPRLENASHPMPAPAPVAPPSASAEPPAPVSAPAPAPASIFTVYFDFDSWTLKAEQLKVLDTVIATARSGGQANIIIVGHTDTSGSADYNQKLSVKRANVVVEALVQMGARRAALHASGVGETDLAVETGDNVKEPRNRRAVITMQP